LIRPNHSEPREERQRRSERPLRGLLHSSAVVEDATKELANACCDVPVANNLPREMSTAQKHKQVPSPHPVGSKSWQRPLSNLGVTQMGRAPRPEICCLTSDLQRCAASTKLHSTKRIIDVWPRRLRSGLLWPICQQCGSDLLLARARLTEDLRGKFANVKFEVAPLA